MLRAEYVICHCCSPAAHGNTAPAYLVRRCCCSPWFGRLYAEPVRWTARAAAVTAPVLRLAARRLQLALRSNRGASRPRHPQMMWRDRRLRLGLAVETRGTLPTPARHTAAYQVAPAGASPGSIPRARVLQMLHRAAGQSPEVRSARTWPGWYYCSSGSEACACFKQISSASPRYSQVADVHPHQGVFSS